jgi:hypothetical protein
MSVTLLKVFLRLLLGKYQMRGKGQEKIFCIGRNKTGTTSLRKAMLDLGYVVGSQRAAEMLLRDWAKRDFTMLAAYCRTGEFFQDIPFSLPYTFQAMDMHYPGSKFILTIRDPESWYKSICQFHRLDKVFGDKAESLEKLKDVDYCYKGFAYETNVFVYDLPGDDPYHKQTLIEHYNFHNRMVQDYFRNRKEDLLVLDVAEDGAYRKLCEFLGKPCTSDTFPWENRTAQLKTGMKAMHDGKN